MFRPRQNNAGFRGRGRGRGRGHAVLGPNNNREVSLFK